ncbi:LADA_0G15522g1_1 [Lachancea dasiensis]|uniref:LADA_0G15522g1_1 n=1 Tax=Lachancea dasiensis TaxID=1072105 RepID=A0A1G4JWG2_9SACH|nr:LADA_0G15522g1_1 [Lachancea dasiensis]
MASVAEDLFREKPVAEVRDYNLHLAQDIARANDNFERELSHRYTDILAITDSVEELLRRSREVDASLMDLCFNDSSYKLEPVADPNRETRDAIDLSRGHSSPASDHLQDAKYALAVAQWTLAVKSFLGDPAAPKNFDPLLSSFESIRGFPHASRYDSTISANCQLLQAAVLEHKMSFSALQWVKLYHLFHAHAGSQVFVFDGIDTVSQLVCDFLLRNEDVLRNSQMDPEVQVFLKAPVFKSKSIESLLKNVEFQFERYYAACERTSTQPTSLNLYSFCAGDSVASFVQDVDWFCHGIKDEQDRKLDNLLVSVSQLIQRLQHYGAETTTVDDIKNRLIQNLEQRLQQVTRERAQGMVSTETTSDVAVGFVQREVTEKRMPHGEVQENNIVQEEPESEEPESEEPEKPEVPENNIVQEEPESEEPKKSDEPESDEPGSEEKSPNKEETGDDSIQGRAEEPNSAQGVSTRVEAVQKTIVEQESSQALVERKEEEDNALKERHEQPTAGPEKTQIVAQQNTDQKQFVTEPQNEHHAGSHQTMEPSTLSTSMSHSTNQDDPNPPLKEENTPASEPSTRGLVAGAVEAMTFASFVAYVEQHTARIKAL